MFQFYGLFGGAGEVLLYMVHKRETLMEQIYIHNGEEEKANAQQREKIYQGILEKEKK